MTTLTPVDTDRLALHIAHLLMRQLDCVDTMRAIHTPYTASDGTVMCDTCIRTYPCDSLTAANLMLERKVKANVQ